MPNTTGTGNTAQGDNLAFLQEAVKTLQAQLTAAELAKKNAETELQKNAEEFQALQDKMEVTERSNYNLEQQYRDINEEYQLIQAKLATAEQNGFALQQQVNLLQQQVSNLQQQIQSLQQSGSAGGETTPISEYEATLRRLVQRVAMILQAEKAVFMIYDRDSDSLIASPPAFGMEDEKLKALRVSAIHGVSGQVFREGNPVIVHDAISDERTIKENVAFLGIKNIVCVPLIIEKRDEQNRIIEKQNIGVLHVFNKRHGGQFNEEDVRLLDRMSRNAASILNNLQLFKEVVKEKEELEHTIDSLVAGLVLVNNAGRITQLNASAKNIFLTEIDVVGQHYQDVFKDEQFQQVIKNALDEGPESEKPAEINIEREGKEHIFQVQSAQVRGEESRLVGAVAILNDITEIRTIERMKSSFVATVSHELRTPLTAIKGFIQTLIQDTDNMFDETMRMEFYNIIDSECDRLTRLITDLLNISRIEAGESLKPVYKDVNVKQLGTKVLMIQRQSTQKHTLILDMPDDMPNIVADEDKLDQIITNLINNSIKYAPNGGEIRLIGRDEGDFITIAVKDQGMGIPKEHLPKVFEKFHRVDNRDNRKIYGTGLGLFLVKHLVEVIHQGTIWADSEGEEKGSTFTVRLPKQIDKERAERETDKKKM